MKKLNEKEKEIIENNFKAEMSEIHNRPFRSTTSFS